MVQSWYHHEEGTLYGLITSLSMWDTYNLTNITLLSIHKQRSYP